MLEFLASTICATVQLLKKFHLSLENFLTFHFFVGDSLVFFWYVVESTEVPDVFSKLFLIEFISAVFGVSHLSKSNSFLQCVSFLLPCHHGARSIFTARVSSLLL